MNTREPFNITAPPGSIIWNWLADVANLGPGLNARPDWIRFRTLLLSAAAPNQTDPTSPRFNPDFDFVWTHTAAFLETLATDIAQISHLAYWQIASAQGFLMPARPQPFSAHGIATAAANMAPLWIPAGFTAVENPVPYVFFAGESPVVNFTCDATFPGVAHVAELILGGAYVHKSMRIIQPKQAFDLSIRMGKSLRRFFEIILRQPPAAPTR